MAELFLLGVVLILRRVKLQELVISNDPFVSLKVRTIIHLLFEIISLFSSFEIIFF